MKTKLNVHLMRIDKLTYGKAASSGSMQKYPTDHIRANAWVWRVLLSTLFLALGLILASPAMAQTTRYVDGISGNDQGGASTCTVSAFPCATINHALGVSSGGDTIDIAAAAYTETLDIDKSITLQGAGEGATIIQAHPQPGQATSRVITIDGEVEVSIAGMTIRHGVAVLGAGLRVGNATLTLTGVLIADNEASGRGGGMENLAGTVTLADVTFSDNVALLIGGGLWNGLKGSATLENVVFSGNEAGSAGGMSHGNGTATLVDVLFANNHAQENGGGMSNFGDSILSGVEFANNESGDCGGGYYAFDSSSTFVEVTFSENSALTGGGLCNDGTGSPELTHVSFFGNTAVGNGGGMLNGGGAPVLTDVAFIDNAAGTNGGGMDNQSSSPVLANVTFIRNLADQHGGGMNNVNSSAVLTNGVFVDNWAGETGGAVRNAVASSLAITNAAFSGNVALVDGGAIRNLNSSPVLSNAIVWNNEANGSTTSASASIFNDGTAAPALSYSLIANSGGSGSWDPDIGVDGGNNIDADPMFVVTPDPGAVPSIDADLRLTEGSPAIDAGDPGTDPLIFPADGDGEPIDRDGNPRYFNTVIDMGPFEWQPLVDAIFSDRFQ
jgi:hypothetical protein